MKRLLALLLALACAFGTACAADDYTVAEKLTKQLWAGSGFTGTLSLEIDPMRPGGLATLQPVVLDVDAIYVRPTEDETESYHADVAWMDGETAKASAHLRVKDGECAFQTDLLGDSWYSLGGAGEGTFAPSALQEGAQDVYLATGMPDIARAAATFGALLAGNGALEQAMEPYKTRIDVWIEGYRQDALLGKLPDGTTTMEVNYAVSPAAVKAEVKQLVLDMLSDETLRPLLTDALGEDMAQLYANPALQSWYFATVDALPLQGDLTIRRVVSLKGDTLTLHISLPMHDPQAGAVTLVYDREKGEGDLPDENFIRMQSGLRTLSVSYQTYRSMTWVDVVQGTLQSEAAADEQPLSVAFTLKQQTSTTRDAEDREVFGYDATLALSADESQQSASPFGEIEIALTSLFKSKELKSAATEMDAKLVFTGEDALITLTLQGTTRTKWQPDAIPAPPIRLGDMSAEDKAQLLPNALLRGLALLDGVVEMPTPTADE